MFSKTNLILILRNWKRNKILSSISILSLVIGLVCSNLLIAFVANEWQISEGSPDKNRIFLLKSDNPMDEQNKEKTSFILPKLPPLIKERYPEVENYCRFQNVDDNSVFEAGDFISDKIFFVRTDKNLGDFFNLPSLAGNVEKTLSNPGEAAITTSIAKLIFGSTDVLGKSFTVEERDVKSLYKITSVIDDSKTASFLKFDILLPLNLNTYFGGVTFVKLDAETSSASVLAKMKDDSKILPRLTETCQYYLQPLTDVYFDTSETQSSWKFMMHRDKSFLYISIIAAIAILLISSFNYVNMYLVRIFKNEKNISIQKMLGANENQLRLQLISETFLAVVAAFLLSFGFVVLLIPVFNSIFGAHISVAFLATGKVVAGYLILILLLTVIPSSYLLLRIGRSPFSHLFKTNSPHFKTRIANSMVALQFTFSIILIIGAMLYSKQLHFISKTANIDKNIIEINANGLPSLKLKTFKNEITRLNGINSATISSTGFLNAWTMLGDDNVAILSYNFDSDFMKTHGFTLKSGEGFSKNEPSGGKQILVNETFVKKFGINDPVGKQLPAFDKSLTIKGVIADFHTESFNKLVKPTIIAPFNFEKDNDLQVIQLQLANIGLAPALAEIKSKWEANFPDKVFNYTFIHDEFNQFHSNYTKTAKIISFFTLISIFLTAFGLFGITWYSIERRIKEIGIRKINGANISEILLLLNKDFVKWVGLAFVVATPFAYYAMHKWLQNFAYKTELSWWIFALAGLLALGIALLTVSWQSWRAAMRNPVEALRYE
jgi:putative ABC transport system permease protein